MSEALQRLLLDHIRRGAWFWLMVGFMQFTAVFSYALTRQTTTSLAYPMMGALFAPMILGTAEQRGWFRALMTLPLSRSELARARWWGAIGLPGLFLMAISIAAMVVFAALGWQQRSSAALALWLLSGWAILGLFAQARSWLKVGQANVAAVRYIMASIYVALAIPLLFFMGAEGYGRLVTVAATAAGLVAAAYLYWRANRVLFWQWGRSGAHPGVSGRTSKASLASAHAGWRALFGQWARRLALFCVFIVLGLGLFALIDRAQGGGFFEFLIMSFLGLFVVVSCFLASPWLSAARAFRTLPVSADRLAAAFLAMTMAPAWAVLLLVLLASVLFPDAAAHLRAPVGLLSVALAALFAPMSLRFGQNAVIFIAVLILIPSPLIDPMVAIFHPDLLAEWMVAWVSAVTVLAAISGYLSFLWLRHELRVGHGAYRVVVLPGQNAAA